jgi:AraC-like DNA-binding protein
MKPQRDLFILKDTISEFGYNSYSIENYILLYDNLNEGLSPLHILKTKKTAVKIEQLMMILISEGEVELNVNGEDYIIQKKSLLYITPDSIIEIKSISPNIKCMIYVIYHELVKQTFFDLGLNFNNLSLTYTFRHAQLNEEAFAYNQELYMELKEDLLRPKYKYQTLFARAYTNLIIADNVKPLGLDNTSQGKKMSKQLNVYNDFIELLNKYSTTNREVQFYASLLGITPKYLSAVCIEYSGKNASSWIDEFVITKAKTLLREQKMNIKSVSEELNFPSQSFFGRYFKRITGLSPKQFINDQYVKKV